MPGQCVSTPPDVPLPLLILQFILSSSTSCRLPWLCMQWWQRCWLRCSPTDIHLAADAEQPHVPTSHHHCSIPTLLRGGLSLLLHHVLLHRGSLLSCPLFLPMSLSTLLRPQFYHACDGDRKFLWCMMPFDVLGHCDFFGAIMSFWVTLVAMARLPERLRAVAFMLAALALAVGVTWDRHSLWTFLVPCAVALAGMLLTWVGPQPWSLYVIHLDGSGPILSRLMNFKLLISTNKHSCAILMGGDCV